MKKIKVINNSPILRNPKTGTWYKQGEEIKNPSIMLLQIAKVHPDVFSIVEEIEKKVEKIEKEIKKVETNVSKEIEDDIKEVKTEVEDDIKTEKPTKKKGRPKRTKKYTKGDKK